MKKLLLLTIAMCLFLSLSYAEEIRIAFATDMHYISPAINDKGPCFIRSAEDGDGKIIMYSEELVNAFVWQIIQDAPDVLVLGGDLTLNGAEQSHLDFTKKLAEIQDAGIPVLVMPGNHDLRNKNAAAFSGETFTRIDSVSSSRFRTIYRDFGFTDAVSKDSESLSYMYQVAPNLQILMLDVNGGMTEGELSEDTYYWADAQLEKAQKAGINVVSVSHQNLMSHTGAVSNRYTFIGSKAMRSLLSYYGVQLSLSGHVHMQHIATDENGLTEIIGSSMVVSPCQYGILTVDGDDAVYETKAVDVAAWNRTQAVQNPELESFAEIADAFFRNNRYQQALLQLEGVENREELAAWFAEVNALYFAGRLDLLENRAELTTQWGTLERGFSDYIQRVVDEEHVNHCVWKGTLK